MFRFDLRRLKYCEKVELLCELRFTKWREMKMSVTVEKTRLSRGNQVVVPARLRKMFGLKEGDEVVWAVLGGEVQVKFVRRRRNALTGLIGKLDMGHTNPDLLDDIVSSG